MTFNYVILYGFYWFMTVVMVKFVFSLYWRLLEETSHYNLTL